ncbi:sensor histidine kinase [Streptomyces krungchingensis]|uniref:sensor histidine kinase n=1 Tax=Streptomyces TaxID=1883 RepID=UPI003CE942AB
MPLFWRIFLWNAVVLVAAAALLLGPVTVSTPILLVEAAILTGGLAAMLVANAFLLRLALAPLRRLTRAMTTTDLLRPGRRPAVSGHGEIAELITTFNTMLDRLEDERATSTARALSAQEAERRRIAQELHDEVGQTLTAVLLELKRVADHAPSDVRAELRQVQETTRGSLDEIRRIARRLRPGVLDELGLASALRSLTTEFAGPGLTVGHRLDTELPALGHETELVLYRVAQEGLTNTARHADAHHAELTLRTTATGVELLLRDDGRGLGGAPEGAGIRGMRERAVLIGADLALGAGPDGGTELRLTVPVPVPDRSGRP